MARSGELNRRAQLTLAGSEGRAERERRRRDALATGRTTSALRQDQQLATRLRELGTPDLAGYLRTAHAAGASFDELRQALGLGRSRLRQELNAAAVVARPTGHNSREGKRSRAIAADRAAAERVGTDDLLGWLAQRRAAGWTLTALAIAVEHSPHWVSARLTLYPPG